MIFSLINSVVAKIGEAFSSCEKDDRGIGVVEVILILVEILTYRYMYI